MGFTPEMLFLGKQKKLDAKKRGKYLSKLKLPRCGLWEIIQIDATGRK